MLLRKITKRQLEALELRVQGLTYKEIAERMGTRRDSARQSVASAMIRFRSCFAADRNCGISLAKESRKR